MSYPLQYIARSLSDSSKITYKDWNDFSAVFVDTTGLPLVHSSSVNSPVINGNSSFASFVRDDRFTFVIGRPGTGKSMFYAGLKALAEAQRSGDERSIVGYISALELKNLLNQIPKDISQSQRYSAIEQILARAIVQKFINEIESMHPKTRDAIKKEINRQLFDEKYDWKTISISQTVNVLFSEAEYLVGLQDTATQHIVERQDSERDLQSSTLPLRQKTSQLSKREGTTTESKNFFNLVRLFEIIGSVFATQKFTRLYIFVDDISEFSTTERDLIVKVLTDSFYKPLSKFKGGNTDMRFSIKLVEYLGRPFSTTKHDMKFFNVVSTDLFENHKASEQNFSNLDSAWGQHFLQIIKKRASQALVKIDTIFPRFLECPNEEEMGKFLYFSSSGRVRNLGHILDLMTGEIATFDAFCLALAKFRQNIDMSAEESLEPLCAQSDKLALSLKLFYAKVRSVLRQKNLATGKLLSSTFAVRTDSTAGLVAPLLHTGHLFKRFQYQYCEHECYDIISVNFCDTLDDSDDALKWDVDDIEKTPRVNGLLAECDQQIQQLARDTRLDKSLGCENYFSYADSMNWIR